MKVPTFMIKGNLISQMGNLKQALNREWTFKKVHKVIRFGQDFWLILHVDIKKELRMNAKYELKIKDYFKLMNKADLKSVEDIPCL